MTDGSVKGSDLVAGTDLHAIKNPLFLLKGHDLGGRTTDVNA